MRSSRRRRLDYDRLAGAYNTRYGVDRLEGIERELRRLGEGAERVLEVGCGTGRWWTAFPGRTVVVGADSSLGMLAQASGGLRVAARANELPFRRGAFDLVYVVNAIHHFDDPGMFVRERLLLRPGGVLAIAGIDPRLIRRRYFYEFFPGTRERDLERFPSFGALADAMLAAGFEQVEMRRAERFVQEYRGAEVWGDPFLARDTNSLMASLSEEEYGEGRRRLEEEIRWAESEGEVAVFRSELDFWMVVGRMAEDGY